MLAGKLTARDFLSRYWQRKPLLLPSALPGFSDPLTPEELAGLACERDVESRLITRRNKRYSLRHGPFGDRDFLSLPETDWTLLVQAVDQWVPEVKQLLREVDFLPSWRVDDVMISYAAPGGGVGPHFDYYDVFLLQGRGSRRWRVGQRCDAATPLRTESGLKLLADFHTEAEYILQPGDMLYIPPGVAHWGESLDESLCYSIGFRAPSLRDMLLSWSEFAAERCAPDVRYTDPRLPDAPCSGEIDAAALKQARRMLLAALRDDNAFARWFGALASEARYPEQILPRGAIAPATTRARAFMLNPASRLNWIEGPDGLLVCVDGECRQWPASTALRELCRRLSRPGATLPASAFKRNAACRELWEELLLRGSLLTEKRR